MRLFGNGREMLSVCPPLAKDFVVSVVPKEECTMRDTLEDLYYGNITPCDKRIKSGTPLQQVLDEAEQCEERLAAQLDDVGKALLHRMADAENEANSTIALENFILGFRLGMRLAIEGLLGNSDGCLADITEEV